MITIERAHYLYTLLIMTPIDFGSLVSATMMSVQLTDQGIALTYGALIIHIAEYARLPIKGLREF